jgi:hypothetical protein
MGRTQATVVKSHTPKPKQRDLITKAARKSAPLATQGLSPVPRGGGGRGRDDDDDDDDDDVVDEDEDDEEEGDKMLRQWTKSPWLRPMDTVLAEAEEAYDNAGEKVRGRIRRNARIYYCFNKDGVSQSKTHNETAWYDGEIGTRGDGNKTLNKAVRFYGFNPNDQIYDMLIGYGNFNPERKFPDGGWHFADPREDRILRELLKKGKVEDLPIVKKELRKLKESKKIK